MSRIRSTLASPVRRRLLAAIASGTLIVLAFLGRFVFDAGAAWAPLMTAAALVAGAEIALRAWSALRIRQFSIELLVTIAAAGALAIGEHWEAAAVTFLFTVGAWLEARTMRRTRGALSQLLAAAPEVAVVIRDGEPVEVSPGAVRVGETVLVKPGRRIPVDGTVSEGAAAVDESAITGESIPAEKSAGSSVWAGTIASNGLLRVTTTGVGTDTTLARIVRRVEEAQEERAPAQRTIDRFASWYTPSIVVLAALAFVFTGDVRLALTLLVVGCPGALVIATPVSVVAGIGRAAREGILIKGGRHLESAGRITALALDKTGTLTEGRPRVAEIVALREAAVPTATMASAGDDAWRAEDSEGDGDGWSPAERDVLRLAAAAEAGSDHPLAGAIVQAARAYGPLPGVAALEEEAGMGVRATVGGDRIVVGNRRLLESSGVILDDDAGRRLDELRDRGRTPVLVAVNGEAAGILGLADTVRASAAPTVRRLHDLGVSSVVMLTGDDPRAAGGIARQVGIDEVHAALLPEQKLAHIARLRAGGDHVAMVGDGINDAPALAAADTSIAMGLAGSDVAIETADIALLSDDLGGIPRAIELSRATLANMRQNLVLALGTVALLLTGVLAGQVHMAGGMLVHQLSVLAVIANATRLLRK